LFTLAKVEFTKSNTLGMDLFWTSTIVLEKNIRFNLMGKMGDQPTKLIAFLGGNHRK
jgi:hypothetical protein